VRSLFPKHLPGKKVRNYTDGCSRQKNGDVGKAMITAVVYVLEAINWQGALVINR
jgi:hypothetical protein